MSTPIIATRENEPADRAHHHVEQVQNLLSTAPRYQNRLRDRATHKAAEDFAAGTALSFDGAQHARQAAAARSPELLVINAIIKAAAQHGARLPSLERRQLAYDVANQMTKQQADQLTLMIAQGNPTPQDHTTRSFVHYQNDVALHIDHALDSRYPYRPNLAAENILAITRGQPVSARTPDFAANPPFLAVEFQQQCEILSALTPERAESLIKAQIDHWTGARDTAETSALTPFLHAVRDRFMPLLQQAYRDSDETEYRQCEAQLATCAEILAHHAPTSNLRPYQHSYPTAPLVAGPDVAQEYLKGGKRHEPLNARTTYITDPLLRETCLRLLEDLHKDAARIKSPTDHFHPRQYHAIMAIADACAIRRSHYEEYPVPADAQPEAPFTHINVNPELLLRIEPNLDLEKASHPHTVVYDAAAHAAVHQLVHAQHTGDMVLFNNTVAAFSQQVAHINAIDFSNVSYFADNADQHQPENRSPDYIAQATINLADTYISHLTQHADHPLSPTLHQIIKNAAVILEHITNDQTPDDDLDNVNQLHVYADIEYAQAIIAAITAHIDLPEQRHVETIS